MTETKPVRHEKSENDKLAERLASKLTQKKFTEFFDLEPEQVALWLYKLAISDNEIRFSPGYFSAGWGHNQTQNPMIEISDITTVDSNYEHEARHGLHNLKCQTLFEGNHWAKNVIKFKNNVLADEKFMDQIKKEGGSPLQEKMLARVEGLINQKSLSESEVKECSWMFGALTYQHAYFVDPGMCEAVASFNDHKAFFVKSSEYNREEYWND